MSEIKLSTDVLSHSSLELSEASNELNRIQKIIAGATPRGYLYEGQLRNKFEQISSGADSFGTKLQNRQEELAKELSDRAKRFEAANQTNNASMVNFFSNIFTRVYNSPVIKALTGLSKLDLAKANVLWSLGGFTGINIFSIISKLPIFNGEIPINETTPYSKEVNISTNINLRDSPSISGQKISVLPAGSSVTQIIEKPVTNKTDKYSWINVKTGIGETGWIASEVLTSPSVPKSTGTIATTGPVQGVALVVSDPLHKGDRTANKGVAIDIAPQNYDLRTLAEIHSLRDGEVVRIGPSQYELDKDTKEPIPDGKGGFKLTGYGNYVVILQDDKKIVYYAHMAAQPDLEIGDKIKAGDKIGMMGNTGYVKGSEGRDGTHLHLEFRQPALDENGNYKGSDTNELMNNNFDPIEYLKNEGFTL